MVLIVMVIKAIGISVCVLWANTATAVTLIYVSSVKVVEATEQKQVGSKQRMIVCMFGGKFRIS